MECFDCKYHETFFDDIGEESLNDGCVCHNEQAEKEDRHLKCCWEYGGKEKCSYRKDDEQPLTRNNIGNREEWGNGI